MKTVNQKSECPAWEAFIADIFSPVPLEVVRQGLVSCVASVSKEGFKSSFSEPGLNL